MTYLKSIFIGMVVSSLALTFFSAIFWDAKLVIIWVLQGIAQGLVAALIYKHLRLTYLSKIITHVLGSYLLALTALLLTANSWGGADFSSIISFTISWFIIFFIVFVYFYFANRAEARKINEKLQKK